ncbi:MAG: hypothetical protein JW852_08370, partial [Spirochaetales bacterium]|nr:hypothetical protein [Spirochaetales bacterium]
MKKRNIIIWIVVLVVIAGAGVAYWLLRDTSDEIGATATEQILTTEAKRGTVSVRVEGPSVVEPYISQDIRAKTSGVVIYAAAEGDPVASGETLVRFDRNEQEAAVKQAELNIAQARIDLAKAELSLETAKADLADKEKLLAGGAVARETVQSAKTALANAQLALESAKVKVDQNDLLLER